MATVKVRVLSHPFRDSKADNVKRRPGTVFECDKARADELIKGGWVELADKLVRRGQAKEAAKQFKPKNAEDKNAAPVTDNK